MESKTDLKIMQTLMGLYKDLDEQIKTHGEETIREHSPELLQKREVIEGYIRNYAEHFYKGFAYADFMEIEEIEEAIARN